MPSSPASTGSERAVSLPYVVAGSVVLSVQIRSVSRGLPLAKAQVSDEPLRALSGAGDASRLKFEDESPLLGWGGLGDTSVVGGSEKTSEGVSMSGVKVLVAGSWGGRAGRDLSTLGAIEGGFLDFLRRRAMSDS